MHIKHKMSVWRSWFWPLMSSKTVSLDFSHALSSPIVWVMKVSNDFLLFSLVCFFFKVLRVLLKISFLQSNSWSHSVSLIVLPSCILPFVLCFPVYPMLPVPCGLWFKSQFLSQAGNTSIFIHWISKFQWIPFCFFLCLSFMLEKHVLWASAVPSLSSFKFCSQNSP